MDMHSNNQQNQIAEQFIKFFCKGNIDSLAGLLSENLRFQGPLFNFDSREAYLKALHDDPPEKTACEIISLTNNDDSVCIFYKYGKGEAHITIAQHFKFQGNLISEILIVFDPRALY